MNRTSLYFLAASIIYYLAFFEHYPRAGWADAAIYNSYVFVGDSYQYIDGYGAALNGANYQGSRLGYIGPLKFMGIFLGASEARFAHNLILYIIYCVSVLFITEAFIVNLVGRVLITGFILYNPMLVGSIVFGGSDGPAAIYSIASLALIYLSMRNRYYLIFSGAFLGLAISSHIFSLLPYVIALSAILLKEDFHRRQMIRLYWREIIFFILGLASVIFLFGTLGGYLGLKHFYLAYSSGRAEASMNGSGANFSAPFIFELRNAAPWIGIVLLSVCVFILRAMNAKGDQQRDNLLERRLALYGLLTPLAFVLSFDFLIGGRLTTSPHYFVAFFPSFTIGLIYFLACWDQLVQSFSSKACLVVVISVNIFVIIQVPNNKYLFNAGKSSGDALISSQQALDREISGRINKSSFNIVYPAPEKIDLESEQYIDYYNGAERTFDYLDSLVFVFPWVGDKVFRINLSGLQAANFGPQYGLPIVFLGKDKSQIDKMRFKVGLNFPKDALGDVTCGGAEKYKWCFLIVKNE